LNSRVSEDGAEQETDGMNLFYNLKSAEQFVYHYTKAETLAKAILPALTVRFSPFATLNDPREYKCWEFGFGTNGAFAGGFDDQAIGKRASDLMKSNCRVFCCTLDEPSSVGMGIDKIYGRGFCRSRMWAQYGEDHAGACIVLDKMAFHVSVQAAMREACSLYCGPVNYRNRSQAQAFNRANPFILNYDQVVAVGLDSAVKNHVQAHYRELFLEKALDWSSENEFRWIANMTEPVELYISFHDSLAAVLLGDNIPIELKKTIISKAQDLEVTIAQLNWKCGVPEVIPVI
jgi:Protein of unknown function (DUF2971)